MRVPNILTITKTTSAAVIIRNDIATAPSKLPIDISRKTLVDKTSVLGRTYAQALPLQGEARLKEIAAMLGGSANQKFETAAKQLLNQATKHKSENSINI